MGKNIVFVDIEGIGTPKNAGVVLPCVACTLSFTTGANQQFGPPQWEWAGGGTFVLTGTVPQIGINAPVALLAGIHVEVGATPGLAGSPPSGLFLSLGTDVKDQTLLDFFGETNPFNFANTEIALGTLTVTNPATGAFVAVPNQADINNQSSVVPAPAALLLIGLGLLAFPLLGRRFA